jgi:hypothetical protein
MSNQFISNTEKAGRALLLRLENLAISDIPAENGKTAVSQIRGGIERLTQIKKVPDDLTGKLLRIFQTISVDNFNASFQQLKKQ